jgi:glycosyltransferase involved in cell wall biosynthesis
LKIAFICPPAGIVNPESHAGSLEIIIYEIARRLAQTEQVTIYARLGPTQQRNEILDGVRCKRLDLTWDQRIEKRLGPFFGSRDPKRPFFASRLYYSNYVRQIAAELFAENYAVAHIYNSPQFATAIRTRNPRLAVILNMQCEWLIQLDQKRVAKHLQSVDRILSCSDFITGGIRSHFPHLADRCATVPNGAYPAQTDDIGSRGQVAKKLLYTGRVSPEKGLHVLIDAFRTVGQNDARAELEIVGGEWVVPRSYFSDLVSDPVVAGLAPLCKPGYVEYLRGRIPVELRSRVSFPGVMPYTKVQDRYRDACLFVHPSICNEAFGMGILEAMMNGLPVITAKAGAQPELVEHEKTGLVVERNDSEALAKAILRLLGDPALRERMGRAGRDRALNFFTWDHVARGILREYHNAISTRRSSVRGTVPESREDAAPSHS